MSPDDPPRPVHGDADTTLGGYIGEHSRPPGFEGIDGEPYTVSLEAERTPDLVHPWEGYLVFPRWASTGLGVVGHLETPTLERGRSQDEVVEALGRLPLGEVRRLLDEAILRRRATASPSPGAGGSAAEEG